MKIIVGRGEQSLVERKLSVRSVVFSSMLPFTIFSSTGVYVFAYAIYFYVERSDMTGLLQTLQYFGYSALLSYAISLALAAVSFLATRKFIFYIYSSVKTD
jgi:hypothetical protein